MWDDFVRHGIKILATNVYFLISFTNFFYENYVNGCFLLTKRKSFHLVCISYIYDIQ
jgi:hypothetical protein